MMDHLIQIQTFQKTHFLKIQENQQISKNIYNKIQKINYFFLLNIILYRLNIIYIIIRNIF